MPTLKNIIYAVVYTFLAVILTKVIIWDVLNVIRLFFFNSFGSSNLNNILIIIQYLVTIMFIGLMPIMFLTGSSKFLDKISGYGG